MRDVPTAHLGVSRGHVASVEESGCRARLPCPRREVVTRAGPIHHQQAQIRHRVSERADLPIENGDDVSRWIDHAVVESVVPVDERGRPLVGYASEEFIVYSVDTGQVASLLLVPLAVPALELSGDVPLVTTEVCQTDIGRRHCVDRRHRVHDRLTCPPTGTWLEVSLRGLAVADDQTVDEFHDIERNGVDRRVVAESECRCDRHDSSPQGVDDAELASHVMGAGEHMAQWRTSKNQPSAIGACHLEREIGVSSCDDIEGKGTASPWHVGFEPTAHRFDIDSRDVLPLCLGAHAPYGSGLFRCFMRPDSLPAELPGSGIVVLMSGPSIVDVTDATFEAEVIEASMQTPVIVDLWAPWCGPCKTLTPILEKAVAATQGRVILAKVNIDENPGVAQAFRVQSIPMVVAIRDGAPVTAFQGAQPEHVVAQFIQELLPTARDEEIAALLRRGDEASLRAVLDIEPGNEDAVVALANMLTARGEGAEALTLLGRVPETDDVRKAAAAARLSMKAPDDYDQQLEKLLDVVKTDEAARQQFLDILEMMGADDPRTAAWRKKLTARLY